MDYAIRTVRDLLGRRPIFGICLGHQLLGLALGGSTFKLKFGHRGANQPVKDLTTGKVEITSQNHGFAVDGATLPTEVAVEKNKKIRRSDVPPDVFRKMCEEWVEQYIGKMKTAVIRLGCSVDLSLEYRTMDPAYIRKVQLSFLILYGKGLIYKGEHPINYCPRCETAIADAEVERLKRTGKLYSIAFGVPDGELVIATTNA